MTADPRSPEKRAATATGGELRYLSLRPDFLPHRPARQAKTDGGRPFRISRELSPTGDQPAAIASLVAGISEGLQNQMLLGVTGSGKTLTMAHVIASCGRPAMIMAPNKILAAQLYGEMKVLFPENAVEYFVSYYDYYQPEAYVPRRDTYIEKEAVINDRIDQMRHAATRALLERDDVIIVASVSCIYGIGAVETYSAMVLDLAQGTRCDAGELLRTLVRLQYSRNDIGFSRGCFRVRGDVVEIWPSHLDSRAWRLSLFGDELESLHEFDPLTGVRSATLSRVRLYPNSHYVAPGPALSQAVTMIRRELDTRLAQLHEEGKLVEAQRLEQRTRLDLEMILATGTCPGIENYSRYLTGRLPGEPPPTLFEYLPGDALLFVDESHVSVPQIGGMFRGDYRRKETLADYGFRLPSCVDNRPLSLEEWNSYRPCTILVSATPGPQELEWTGGVIVEQLVRPTGLLDPVCTVRPVEGQVDDLLGECRRACARQEKVLVTTLTRKMAENLTEYMNDNGLSARYMHAGVRTMERIELVRGLRTGEFDILVGINLLREGLDIPECALVAILDADKEGFLRSATSLIQTIGRAARHVDGRVLLYADRMTASLEMALAETQRRRDIQARHNARHGITPESIGKRAGQGWAVFDTGDSPRATGRKATAGSSPRRIAELEADMRRAAENLEFEEAARLRDMIRELRPDTGGRRPS